MMPLVWKARAPATQAHGVLISPQASAVNVSNRFTETVDLVWNQVTVDE